MVDGFIETMYTLYGQFHETVDPDERDQVLATIVKTKAQQEALYGPESTAYLGSVWDHGVATTSP